MAARCFLLACRAESSLLPCLVFRVQVLLHLGQLHMLREVLAQRGRRRSRGQRLDPRPAAGSEAEAVRALTRALAGALAQS